MSVQKRQINKVTGKGLIRAATGKAVFAADGTPCGCGCSPCSKCDTGTTPSTVQVTFAGFTFVSACHADAGGGSSWKLQSFSLNGTYCLPRCLPCFNDGSDCFWGDTFLGVASMDIWCPIPANLTCAGTRSANYNIAAIVVGRASTPNRWQLSVSLGDAIDAQCSVSGSQSALGCRPGAADVLVQAEKTVSSCSSTQTTWDFVTTEMSITAGTITLTPNGC